VNAEITTFDESLKTIADEMLLVMYASEGIGLAGLFLAFLSIRNAYRDCYFLLLTCCQYVWSSFVIYYDLRVCFAAHAFLASVLAYICGVS
jgi:hypothetical protein